MDQLLPEVWHWMICKDLGISCDGDWQYIDIYIYIHRDIDIEIDIDIIYILMSVSMAGVMCILSFHMFS